MFTLFGMQAPILEIIMLFCFGCAWPISIYKTAKSRSTAGKSVVFSFVVLVGYLSGLLNKLIVQNIFDIACFFYIINFIMVAVDAALWFRNRALEKSGRNGSAS